MSDGEHPIAVLCDTHVIPILMFLDGSGPSRKTDIYAAVGRNANMPLKLERMAEAGLVEISHVGNSEVVGLTELGSAVSVKLHEIGGLWPDPIDINHLAPVLRGYYHKFSES